MHFVLTAKIIIIHFWQLGRCRLVTEFEKLNRIGEGTYGVVCKLLLKF